MGQIFDINSQVYGMIKIEINPEHAFLETWGITRQNYIIFYWFTQIITCGFWKNDFPIPGSRLENDDPKK